MTTVVLSQHRTDAWTAEGGYTVQRIRESDGSFREFRVYAKDCAGWAGVLSLREVRECIANHRRTGNWNGFVVVNGCHTRT